MHSMHIYRQLEDFREALNPGYRSMNCYDENDFNIYGRKEKGLLSLEAVMRTGGNFAG